MWQFRDWLQLLHACLEATGLTYAGWLAEAVLCTQVHEDAGKMTIDGIEVLKISAGPIERHGTDTAEGSSTDTWLLFEFWPRGFAVDNANKAFRDRLEWFVISIRTIHAVVYFCLSSSRNCRASRAAFPSTIHSSKQ